MSGARDSRQSFPMSVAAAYRGLVGVVISERNVRIDIICGLLAVMVGWLVWLPMLEWLAIVLVIGLVLVAEILNSVIEQVIDWTLAATTGDSNHFDAQAGKIKDMSAGAPLIAALIALVVAGLIFVPELYELVTGNMIVRERNFLGVFGTGIVLLWFCGWWLNHPLPIKEKVSNGSDNT